MRGSETVRNSAVRAMMASLFHPLDLIWSVGGCWPLWSVGSLGARFSSAIACRDNGD